MKIKYLKNHQINFIRWDNCINNSINGSIFAYSWYLNIICENWEALVIGDYEYVMPLLQFERYKQKFISSPKLSNRLGIFSNRILSEKISNEFIKSIPQNFSRINLHLNKFNKLSGNKTTEFRTFELDLMQSYENLFSKFSPSFQGNINVAKENKINIIHGLALNDFFDFSLNRKNIAFPILKKNELSKLRLIISYGLKYNLIDIYGAYSYENNLCAVALILRSKQKMHLLFNSINNYGLKTNALHLLINNFIKTHSEKNLTLNLENIIKNNDSDFLSGVGAHSYKYTRFFMSKLPLLLKILLKYSGYGKYTC
ncbi:MAG: hypothetical protein JEY96_16110 [Bacteroidales bacterium]|nr:hypothetical protein [Bacteroidales bacterium]